MNSLNYEQTHKKIKKMSLIYYILQLAFLIIGIIMMIVLKANWYWFAVSANVICYAAIGLNAGNMIDDYVRMRYPQFYGKKDRPSNSAIKRAAKAAGDQETLSLKKSQSRMFAFFVIIVVIYTVFSLCVIY